MVHSLRKYLSNRGSALFMVISTMTALMVTCMAMYFAVVSSRTAQIAVFNQEQSYQAARSTTDLFLNGLQNGLFGTGEDDLREKMRVMDPGEVITTNGNGFASLNPDATGKDDEDLGAYDVTITRLNDEKVDGVDYLTYDVAVTTSINGMREVVHSVIHMDPPSLTVTVEDSESDVFASTGYTDQDSYIDGGVFMTDMFIDNENAVINAYVGMGNEFRGNLSAGGSLQINGYLTPDQNNPVVWAIRNKLYESPDKNFGLQFKSTDSNRSKVLIGGDLDMGDNWGGISNADIYVNGDWYYGQSNFNNCRMFVHGNIYIRKAGRNLDSFPVYCDGQVFEIEGGQQQGSVDGTWEGNDKLPSGALNRHEAMTTLESATATTTYYKWEINDRYPKKRVLDPETNKWKTTSEIDPTYVPELDETHNKDVHKTLEWDWNNANKIVETLTYGDDGDGKGVIIDDTKVNRGNNSTNSFALIIDTGDDPDNVFTIRVKANRDADGDGIKETFWWYPLDTIVENDPQLRILVKGRGSVVIDVPKGVTYQDTVNTKTMHYNWFMLSGGSADSSTGVGNERFNLPTSGVPDTVKKYIHKNCGDEHDECTYTEESTDKECQYCKDVCQKKDCTKKKKKVTCAIHEYSFSYCPCCDKELKNNNFAGKCLNRVGRQEIDKDLAENPALAARMEKDSDGKLIYPTTNIFLVSVDESADIRLSITRKGEIVRQNSLFGFIYAPYMTFKGFDEGSNGGMMRFFGGATVSDFIFQSSASYATCWPEKLPEQLMSSTSRGTKLTGVSKDWKISLGTY